MGPTPHIKSFKEPDGNQKKKKEPESDGQLRSSPSKDSGGGAASPVTAALMSADEDVRKGAVLQVEQREEE